MKKAVDMQKDQSYVLYSLTQEQLAHTLFPLGEMTKSRVREIAEERGFVNARKHDSQDICFVQNGDYADFIENRTGKCYRDGDFVDRNGKVIGRHRGIIHYTVGKRKGLGISYDEPLYVCAIDKEKNTVTLGKESELYSRILTAKDINLISVPYIDRPCRLKAKVRYRGEEKWATVKCTAMTLSAWNLMSRREPLQRDRLSFYTTEIPLWAEERLKKQNKYKNHPHTNDFI